MKEARPEVRERRPMRSKPFVVVPIIGGIFPVSRMTTS